MRYSIEQWKWKWKLLDTDIYKKSFDSANLDLDNWQLILECQRTKERIELLFSDYSINQLNNQFLLFVNHINLKVNNILTQNKPIRTIYLFSDNYYHTKKDEIEYDWYSNAELLNIYDFNYLNDAITYSNEWLENINIIKSKWTKLPYIELSLIIENLTNIGKEISNVWCFVWTSIHFSNFIQSLLDNFYNKTNWKINDSDTLEILDIFYKDLINTLNNIVYELSKINNDWHNLDKELSRYQSLIDWFFIQCIHMVNPNKESHVSDIELF